MYTALRATSTTLSDLLTSELKDQFESTWEVTLNTPQEMNEAGTQGLSVWLYKIERDNQHLNSPPKQTSLNRLIHKPLPLRLHYLMTPLVNDPKEKQKILGKVLQTFHDHPEVAGSTLREDFQGTSVKLLVRLESLGLEELTRVWDSLEISYQLCISYEVTPVMVDSALEAADGALVDSAVPEYGVITGGGTVT